MATIRDVAEHAGVSIATVSRVMNDYQHVRPAVRARVQAAVTALGYRPNGLASRFRTQRSRIIGVFLRQQRTPFSSALGYAIENELLTDGYRVLLCSTDGDPDREERYIHSMLEMRAEGVIIRPTGSAARTSRHVALLREAGTAIVFVDMKPPLISVSAVLCDNFAGGYDGIRHLVELGHRRIGVIASCGEQTGGVPGFGNVGMERVRGIRRAAADLGTGIDLAFSEPFADSTVDRGAEECARLLNRNPALTAIFGTTDVLAIGAMQTALRRGLSVPGKLSILGYDGVMESALTLPQLSTVCQPIHDMGALAARTLLQHIARPHTPARQTVLENALLVRGSTAIAPA